jgi:hypothetical protein
MNAKELFRNHCIKSASHHDAMAKCHAKIAESHNAIAAGHTDQTIAQGHRDLAAHHARIAHHHKTQQEHFEGLREALAAASDADVFDSREDETRTMQHALGHADLLKAARLLLAD